MKLALLHYSFWPEPGGVEHAMRDQANLLRRAGHEVTVLTGVGLENGDDYLVRQLPELAPDFELNKLVRSVLERGQADQNFNKYRAILTEALNAALTEIEVTFVHNVFTTHFNLVLTRVLHDLAPRHRMVAWTHDLTATNSDYALPNPHQPPWNLMKMSAPGVTYVAISELRARELKQLKPEPAVTVIPDAVDPVRVFGLTPEIRESLPSLSLAERDWIFLLPARTLMRKNIEFALEMQKKILAMGKDPLLLITGAVPNHPTSQRYGEFLRQSLPRELFRHAVFVSDFFVVQDDTMRDLFLLADCLLFPSKQEGFGLPIVEAGLYRLPVLCRDIPAYAATRGEGAFLLDEPGKIPEALAWLEGQPTVRHQRQCRRLFHPDALYRRSYEPLLAALAPAPAPL